MPQFRLDAVFRCDLYGSWLAGPAVTVMVARPLTGRACEPGWESQAMPVSPSGVSGISACHFRTCGSLDELWIFRVRPATFKYRRALKSETTKLPPCSRLDHSFELAILAWNSAYQTPLFLPSSCSVCLSRHLTNWKFQSSALESEILWKRYYCNLPEYFASTFSLVMPI